MRIGEFYYDGRSQGKMMTDAEYAAALEKLAGKLPVRRVIVDPSAASFIAQLRQQGKFSVRRAKNAVLPGIRLVAKYLQEGRLLVADSCENAIREFGCYRWEESTQKDMPRKEADHAMDEIRYFCATVLARRWN